MGRNHSRLGAWLLAMMTCVFIAGGHAAYASSTQARVHAAGQYFHNDPDNTNGSFSDRVSFGLEGKCPVPNTPCTSNGNFEFENHFTHFHAHGKVTTLSVNSQPTAQCLMLMASIGIDMTGRPSATASGSCKDGSCTTFNIEVIDGDDNAPDQGDWVCSVQIFRQQSTTSPAASDSTQQLLHGDVEVKTTSEH